VPLGGIVGLRHQDHDSTNKWTRLEVHTAGELHLPLGLFLRHEIILYRYHCGIGQERPYDG
jgi:hypothetical protein